MYHRERGVEPRASNALLERSTGLPASGAVEGLGASLADIAALRGVTDAAADVSECACPEPCERDHANE